MAILISGRTLNFNYATSQLQPFSENWNRANTQTAISSIWCCTQNKYLSYLKVTNQRSCLNRNRICSSFPREAQFWRHFFVLSRKPGSLFTHVLKYFFQFFSLFHLTVIYIVISLNATSNKFNMTYWCL